MSSRTSKSYALVLIIIVAFSIVSLLIVKPSSAQNRTIVVPDDYSNVSSAIKNAVAGDIIKIRSGVFQEEELYINKQIAIISEIPFQTILNIHPSIHPTYYYGATIMTLNDSLSIQADNVKLSGLIIKNQKPDFMGNASTGLNNYGLISANGNQIQITNNIIGNKEMPIKLALNGNNNQVIGNTITSINTNGNNVTISNNSISGILVSGSNNEITKNIAGTLTLVNADNNIATSNSFTKEQGGGEISLIGANYNTFSNNIIITDLTCAVAFAYPENKGGSHNLFINNTMEDAKLWGILLGLGDYNVFYKNTIANNGGLGHDGYGLAIGGTHREVNNNLFYGNTFMNNSKNFGTNWEVVGSNSFDNGSMGNYWDDYLTKYPNAVEIGNSGIGNIPYQVYGSILDNYPLMKIPNMQNDSPITVPSQSTNPYPTPTVPEFAILAIIPLMVAILIGAIIVRTIKQEKSV
jgi:parallel beta-helix repeat protein